MTSTPISHIVFRFTLLYILYLVCFILGSTAVAGALPTDMPSEPGLVPDLAGLLIVAFANVFIVGALILTSRWRGWKLALSLALAYYGAVTFVMQIETWYFLSTLTVGPELLPRLFLMGVPTAFLFIPLSVRILGRWRQGEDPLPSTAGEIPAVQWVWKLSLIALSYLVLYWLAGYFIAWQNLELRAFYGQPGPELPFLEHTTHTLRNDPWLFPFQVLRSLIWVACALPVIRGSGVPPWLTALLVGLLFSVPQNIGHILANPLIPGASVRMSHMIETASSTFLFGMIVVWLLHRRHTSLSDLLNIPEEHV